jgi:hypothetical protein
MVSATRRANARGERDNHCAPQQAENSPSCQCQYRGAGQRQTGDVLIDQGENHGSQAGKGAAIGFNRRPLHLQSVQGQVPPKIENEESRYQNGDGQEQQHLWHFHDRLFDRPDKG